MRQTSITILLAILFVPFYAVAQKRMDFKNGQFKIAQFTDVHWHEGSPKCEKTVSTIEAVLRAEQPDLVVLSGDIVTTKPAMEGWKSVTSIFERAKMPFVVLMGNHDAEVATKKEIYDYLLTCQYYVGERGPEDITGYGNSIMTLYGEQNGGTKPAALLYFLDSNDYPAGSNCGTYDWIHFDQIAWYRQQSEQFTAANGGQPLPALAYFHIPLPEYKEIIGAPLTYGIYNEGEVCSPDYNSGIFTSFIEKGDVMGMFVGHDHNNDYIGMLKDIVMAYGRKTGFDSYGDLTKGARIVLLYEGKRQFDTWITTPQGKEVVYYYPSGFNSAQEESSDYLQPVASKAEKHGVEYTYYEGSCKKISDIAQCKEVKHGTMNNISIDNAASENFFAYKYRTLIMIPERGIYNFFTKSDDGSQLFIDGKLVVNNDGSHSPRKVYGQIAVEKGLHEIVLLYFNGTAGKHLEVGFYNRNTPETTLADKLLYLPE